MTTDTLGQIEAAMLSAQRIKSRATATLASLEDLRWRAIKELARPRPGDREAGLLDGVDLQTLEWTEQIGREQGE